MRDPFPLSLALCPKSRNLLKLSHSLIPAALCSSHLSGENAHLSFTWIQSQWALTAVGHVTAYRSIYLLQGLSTAGGVTTACEERNEADERERNAHLGASRAPFESESPCRFSRRTNSLWRPAKVSLAITVTVAYCRPRCPHSPTYAPECQVSSGEMGGCWWQ